MSMEKDMTNTNKTLACLFGFDHLEIDRINDSKLNIVAVISSGETVITFYKLFLSYIQEIEKAKNDREALNMFKTQLSKYKKAFDDRMGDACEQIISMIKNYKVDVVLCYEGEFKAVYDKISEFVF